MTTQGPLVMRGGAGEVVFPPPTLQSGMLTSNNVGFPSSPLHVNLSPEPKPGWRRSDREHTKLPSVVRKKANVNRLVTYHYVLSDERCNRTVWLRIQTPLSASRISWALPFFTVVSMVLTVPLFTPDFTGIWMNNFGFPIPPPCWIKTLLSKIKMKLVCNKQH